MSEFVFIMTCWLSGERSLPFGLLVYTQYNLSYLMFVPNFKILGQIVLEKSLTKICIYIQSLNTVALIDSELIRWKKLLERKKKRQIKGLISHMRLILLYTVQPVMPDVCTKFQNPRSSSS